MEQFSNKNSIPIPNEKVIKSDGYTSTSKKRRPFRAVGFSGINFADNQVTLSYSENPEVSFYVEADMIEKVKALALSYNIPIVINSTLLDQVDFDLVDESLPSALFFALAMIIVSLQEDRYDMPAQP